MICPVWAISQTELPETRSNMVVSVNKWIDKTFGTYDTAFVKKSSNRYVGIVRSSNWLDFYHFNFGNDAAIAFRSDLCYNLGFSVGYKSILLGYSISLTDAFSNRSVGSRKLDFHVSTNRFSVDLYHVSNKGQTNLSSYKSSDGQQNLRQPFDGLSTKTLTLDVYYYFNKYRYSSSAAYSRGYTNQQVKSAGSFITGLSYSSQNIFFDFTELSAENPSLQIPQLGVQRIRYDSYCVNVGYGYNWLFSKAWLANVTVIPAVGVNVHHDKADEGNLSVNAKTKAALVYNAPRYFMGITCHYYSNWYFSDQYTLENSIGSFDILFGLRF
ncbi:MAG: DUF4421 domain-containing protein [Breznakibacter sp.]